jgi:hypothetical protein
MHGNVEEWCGDWYGPYAGHKQSDPAGRADGDFKVTRGGSHSTGAYYLRSANRMGTVPEDRHWLIGFRVVIGEQPRGRPLPPAEPPAIRQNVNQSVPAGIEDGPDPAVPYFEGPREVARIPAGSTGPLYHKHSHFTALIECPNGDLLAAWFTGMGEHERELSVAASRLRYGRGQWDEPGVFWDAPDRNDHAHALWNDGSGTIYHFNGLGVRHRNLAVVLRKSTDNGAAWSKPRLILPEHGGAYKYVVESVFRAHDGTIFLPFDGRGGSILAASRDEGLTWRDPGGTIRGTHAGVTQLCDGRLIALGRHGAINGMMPKSTSCDMGKTWTSEAGPFSSIGAGRRLALLKLRDGSIFCGSFARGMEIANSSGKSHTANGLFASLSLDGGQTWPYRRILCEGSGPHPIKTMDAVPITIDSATGEPVGYLSSCQGRDGTIHLLSSYNHYAFNTAWLKELPPPPPQPEPGPVFRTIPLKAALPEVYEPNEFPDGYRWRWGPSISELCESGRVTASGGVLKIHPPEDASFYFRTDEVDGFGAADPEKGFTVETAARILSRKPGGHALVLELYDGAGGRYSTAITEDSLLWYEGDVIPSGLMSFDEYAVVAENLDNTDAMHTFRIAVRPDNVAHIYRDGRLLGVRRPRYRSPRFSYIMIGAGKGCRAQVDYVAYDLGGPYGPPPAGEQISLKYGPRDCVLDTTDPNFSHEGPSTACGWRKWPQFDVKSRGAAGDGQTLDTPAIQEAIDAAAAAGGGRVVLRGGRFLSGSIFLKAGSALVIETDATLLGTTDESQYPTVKTRVAGVDMPWPAGLVNADNVHGVRITGGGTIDGSGRHWWGKFNAEGPLGGLYEGKPRPIIASRCRDVYIGDITIKNSPFWTCHLVYCEKVDVNNVTVRNKTEGVWAPSADGIDIDSCRDVLVRNCDIDADDDCICIKSGRDGDGYRRSAASENIVVRDCLTRRGHGMVAVGTEIGGSVRNVHVYNCRAEDTNFGVRFKSKIGRGGVIENIVYENISMAAVGGAVRMRLTDTRSNFPQLVDPQIPVLGGELAIPRFRNILLKDISAVDSQYCFSFRFDAASPAMENITFDNVVLEGAEDIQTPQQARCKNWNVEGLSVNGKKLFAECSGPGAPKDLYERVKAAVAHVKPLE